MAVIVRNEYEGFNENIVPEATHRMGLQLNQKNWKVLRIEAPQGAGAKL